MQVYKAPIRDMRFVVHELHGSAYLGAMPGFEDVTPELIDAVLEQAGKFAATVLLPINASGDEEGCTYENGVVRTPAGFRKAYESFREAGWTAVTAAPEYGGQGLPEVVNKPMEEMVAAANTAFSLYPVLSHGAYQAIADHGSEALKRLYLPRLVDGTWSGTMCLTEPHCGTDLGLLRTKAVPRADGSYGVSGTKIFITGGDHDLTENVIHLVLGRLPDAPPGVKGISLFLVPKFLPDQDGKTGVRNGVACRGIEHKMGIKASATCQIDFDDATGWLVGEPHQGLRAMFTMMNSERLSIGVQGTGIAEAAYQSAAFYAKDRAQGRSPSRGGTANAHPIIVHADVRRMLMTMRAYTEGCRALGGWVAQKLDVAARSTDAAEREAAEEFTALVTPVVKALFTDLGFEVASLGVQVHGGHGYVRDHGVEQYVRDARIGMIYEGTNGIQAMDLVSRKLSAKDGAALRHVFDPMRAFVDANRHQPGLQGLVDDFARALDVLQAATGQVAAAGRQDLDEAGAVAADYLRLFGLVIMGFMWVRSAAVSHRALETTSEDTRFYRAKLHTARFFVDRLLPQVEALGRSVSAGKASVMAMDETDF